MHTVKTAKVRKVNDFKILRAVHEVWQIKAGDVIPNYHVRVDPLEEFGPF